MLSQWHQRLLEDGWHLSTDSFWESIPCFYDLGIVKTVILFKMQWDGSSTRTCYAEHFYWKHGGHDLPDFLEPVEIRRYKLHHSMNALLWHDHGDRPLWPI